MCMCVYVLSCVQLFVTLWTLVYQAPLSMGLSRQEYWSGLPFPPPGDLPEQGSNPCLLCLLHWQAVSLPLYHLGGPEGWIDYSFSTETSMDSGRQIGGDCVGVQEQGRTCSWVVLILKQ